MFNPTHWLKPDFCWPQPLTEMIHLPGINRQVAVLRLDLLHPLISGNKAFKLHWHLHQAQQTGKRQLLSFGGAWSNHLLALAAAGQALGYQTVGLVRGEAVDNPVLSRLHRLGMQLRFINREAYRQARQDPLSWQAQFPEAWIIPEGGADIQGVQGAAEIQQCIPTAYRSIICACGTGTTLAGLLQTAPAHQFLLGIAVLKGASFLQTDIQRWLKQAPQARWQLETRFHCGGYARSSPALHDFLKAFAAQNTLPIEPVYTGKALYGLSQYLQEGNILPEPLLFLHTGGVIQKES